MSQALYNTVASFNKSNYQKPQGNSHMPSLTPKNNSIAMPPVIAKGIINDKFSGAISPNSNLVFGKKKNFDYFSPNGLIGSGSGSGQALGLGADTDINGID